MKLETGGSYLRRHQRKEGKSKYIMFKVSLMENKFVVILLVYPMAIFFQILIPMIGFHLNLYRLCKHDFITKLR